MSRWSALRPALPILLGASVLLSLAMGLRQSLGLFMMPMTRDIGISVSDFTIAISVQNLAWGLLQPFAGALAARRGYRPLLLGGSALYLLGLVLLACAQGLLGVLLGAGVLIGAALACTGSALSMAVAARSVPAALRSFVLGLVSAAGSLGALVAAPLGQVVAREQGWRMGVAVFVVLALAMLPAAWYAGRADRVPVPPSPAHGTGHHDNARAALRHALAYRPFTVMALAYFVCGMQLVFLTTHLPAYLDLCGMDPMLSAQALGLIGGFNVLGSLFFGWAGGRWPKQVLLGLIYVLRSFVVAWYFHTLPTVDSTLVFASVMGFLWLGVAPLVSGWIADTFGLRWQAMLAGVAFCSHQIGSFLGAFGGGLVYDLLGNYQLAWQVAATLGLAAGITQIAFAFAARPPTPPPGTQAAPG
ncbi:MAG TPA: MFS transporter [Pseudorhodoferax sp.]|jgi:predicted MFS family arabinose efflux permease|nr:MFS transporter [Pseudorhodoferax sp.]